MISGFSAGVALFTGDSGAAATKVTNPGTIASEAGRGVVQFEIGNVSLVDTGLSRALASYSGNNLRDTIVNSGRMVGDVLLFVGNDSYSGATGQLSGRVFGFHGADTMTGGPATDPVLGRQRQRHAERQWRQRQPLLGGNTASIR